MEAKQAYWIGARPSDGKRWQGAEAATALDMRMYREQLFHLYQRYAKQWNDIELNAARSLSEHTHRICGAQVIGSPGKFVLKFDQDRENGWILQLAFAQGFRQFCPGLSCGLNALRSPADIRSAALHWRGHGRKQFDDWTELERKHNQGKGEWGECK